MVLVWDSIEIPLTGEQTAVLRFPPEVGASRPPPPHPKLPPPRGSALVCGDLRELLVDLLHDELVHLPDGAGAVGGPQVILLPQDPLQRGPQVVQPVLVLAVVGGAHDGVHERQVLHPQLHGTEQVEEETREKY